MSKKVEDALEKIVDRLVDLDSLQYMDANQLRAAVKKLDRAVERYISAKFGEGLRRRRS